jgi:hypothetical protein
MCNVVFLLNLKKTFQGKEKQELKKKFNKMFFFWGEILSLGNGKNGHAKG